MAVHTELDAAEIDVFLEGYGLGPATAAEGVAEGSIHTTYRVVAGGRTRYLRLTEGLSPEAVDFELTLLRHLTTRDLPVPAPLADRRGRLQGQLRGRPAVLFEAVPGRSRPATGVGTGGLAEVGRFLGTLHRAAENFPRERPNPYAPAVIAGWLEALRGPTGARLDPEITAALPGLSTSLSAAAGFTEGAGPEAVGVCHGDLFPDNVLWDGDHLSGVLDFEMACTAPRILDLAVVLLVWAFDEGKGRLVPARCRALATAYAMRRTPGPGERAALFDACRFVAVRYTVTRIRDFHLSELPEDRLVRKDWRAYRDRLVHLEAIGPAAFENLVGVHVGG